MSVVAKSTRLLMATVLLAVVTVALAVQAVRAHVFANDVHHWPSSLGIVIPPGPTDNGAAVRFFDPSLTMHLMTLHSGDTDDMPVGSLQRVSYHVMADGRLRTEIVTQPRALASALTVLALVAAAGTGVAWWRFRAERTAEAGAQDLTDRP
jgi:hypothetical protein